MADKRKISVTEALKELKLYDSKIAKAINASGFVGAKKKSVDKVGVQKTSTFIDKAKSDYQSILDLISNRAAIKAAIVQSNANTVVEIAGNKYTVAQAIERKNSIEYEKLLLDEMKSQWMSSTTTIDRENKKVDAQVDKMLEAFLGKDSDKKVSETDLSVISDQYRNKNEWELVDPLDLYTKMTALEAQIDAFEADVDIRLSISNSITYIEV